jgi:anthranilate 1,2-dioxygenase small subunit
MTAQIRSAIEQLMADYAEAIDDDRLEEWPQLFTERCRYLVTNQDNHSAGLPHGTIFANSRGMLEDRVSALRDANIYERQRYRHIISRPQISQAEGDLVEAKTGFVVFRIMHNGDTELFVTGLYLDKFDISGERPLLAERIVVCDSRKLDTLLALPL